jgi:hypothetical protein
MDANDDALRHAHADVAALVTAFTWAEGQYAGFILKFPAHRLVIEVPKLRDLAYGPMRLKCDVVDDSFCCPVLLCVRMQVVRLQLGNAAAGEICSTEARRGPCNCARGAFIRSFLTAGPDDTGRTGISFGRVSPSS